MYKIFQNYFGESTYENNKKNSYNFSICSFFSSYILCWNCCYFYRKIEIVKLILLFTNRTQYPSSYTEGLLTKIIGEKIKRYF